MDSESVRRCILGQFGAVLKGHDFKSCPFKTAFHRRLLERRGDGRAGEQEVEG
jgi:hypothetical protein